MQNTQYSPNRTFRNRGRVVSSRYKKRLISDINVTPFVDVMLVLLVIFMATSPMVITGVEVDLPQTKAGPIGGNDEPIVLSVDKDGMYYMHKEKLGVEQLEMKLYAIKKERAGIRVFVRGDKNVAYGRIMELFGLVKNVGFKNVALVTEIFEKDDKIGKVGKVGKVGSNGIVNSIVNSAKIGTNGGRDEINNRDQTG